MIGIVLTFTILSLFTALIMFSMGVESIRQNEKMFGWITIMMSMIMLSFGVYVLFHLMRGGL